jgi:AcrR family transcriptional regulator
MAHPSAPPDDTDPAGRARRSDGAETRSRLLHAALRLFAAQGYTRTSTREIAQAAQANIGAIAYYFGDKQGLYRAAYTEPMCNARDDIARFADPGLSLREALQGVYAGFAEPFRQDELVRQCTRLHLREMVEPTGLGDSEIRDEIGPYHHALVTVLCRHFGVTEADDALHRLAFSLISLGAFLYFGRDIVEALRPALTATPAAIDHWAATMVEQGCALVDTEARRRHATPT